jgi:hypothetical protein
MLLDWLIYGVTTELVVEDVEVVEVIRLTTFMLGLMLNRVIVDHFLNISLNSITFSLNLPFSTRTSIFVFRFCILLFSHEFWKLKNCCTYRILVLMIERLLQLLSPQLLKSI